MVLQTDVICGILCQIAAACVVFLFVLCCLKYARDPGRFQWISVLFCIGLTVSILVLIISTGGTSSPTLPLVLIPTVLSSSLFTVIIRTLFFLFIIGSIGVIFYMESNDLLFVSKFIYLEGLDMRPQTACKVVCVALLSVFVSVGHLADAGREENTNTTNKLKEVEKKSETLTKFVAFIFHEVRSPLHVIRSVVGDLLDGLGNHEVRLRQEFEVRIYN